MTIETTLLETVARIIDRRREQGRISPSWVATEAMQALDPGRVSLEVVYGGCHLQCRQIAREQLRRKFEDSEPEQLNQHEIWPDLQWRYPTARTAKEAEPEYVLLEQMSGADIAYNVTRLRSEAKAKMKHADALEAFGNSRDQAA